MLYYDVINKAMELTVVTDEETSVSYLEPCYRDILRENDLCLPGREAEGDPKDQELWEILKLEVEKRNAKRNVAHALAEWAYQILTETIDPALLSEETELMKNITEYLQANQEVKEAKEELAKKPDRKLPAGINFAKKAE